MTDKKLRGFKSRESAYTQLDSFRKLTSDCISFVEQLNARKFPKVSELGLKTAIGLKLTDVNGLTLDDVYENWCKMTNPEDR